MKYKIHCITEKESNSCFNDLKAAGKYCLIDKNGVPYCSIYPDASLSIVVFSPQTFDASATAEAYAFFSNYCEQEEIDFKHFSTAELLSIIMNPSSTPINLLSDKKPIPSYVSINNIPVNQSKQFKKTREAIDELIENINHFEKRLNKLCDYVKNEFNDVEKIEDFEIDER